MDILGGNKMILKEIDKLIDKYEVKLKEGDYSIVDNSLELKEVIKDLKGIKNKWEESREEEPKVDPNLIQYFPTLFGNND